MDIKEICNILKEKYNYNDELVVFLEHLVPVMVDYFGEEYKEKIVTSFLETPIIITNNTLLDELSLKNRTDLLLAGGGYAHGVEVVDGNPVRVSKVIKNGTGYNSFNFNDSMQVGNLVHELCHMVKSGINIEYDSNQIIDYCGLSKTYGTIVNGEYVVQSNNKGTGLEEALNAIDEANIMKMMYGDYEITSNYTRLASYIYPMIYENEDFLSIVRESQFNGSSEWKLYLGEELSEELLELCYKHYDLMVNRMFELINNKNLQQDLENTEEELKNIVLISRDNKTR